MANVSRISSFAANEQLTHIILKSQQRLHDFELQVASEKKSQSYSGISRQAERLVTLENSRTLLERYIQNNDLQDLRLKTTDVVVEGMRTTLKDFRESLLEFEASDMTNQVRVNLVQDAALRALKDLEMNLNADVDGRYVFSGARTSTRPANFNLTTLAAFQATYNGTSIVYPPTRGGHLADFTTSTAVTGNLTFSVAGNSITAANAGTLNGIAVGAKITVAGAAAGNNRTYTVVSNNGTTITVNGTITGTSVAVTNTLSVNETVAATLSASDYYSGDRTQLTHRVDEDREFTLDTYAIDPAFEKAARAMGIIAQGVFGTAGGLGTNKTRVRDAIYLLDSALYDRDPGGTPPYGAEQSGSIESVQRKFGFDRALIDQTNAAHRQLMGFFETQISNNEDVDKLEAITRLLDESRSLEASFQALARVRELQLADFIV